MMLQQMAVMRLIVNIFNSTKLISLDTNTSKTLEGLQLYRTFMLRLLTTAAMSQLLLRLTPMTNLMAEILLKCLIGDTKQRNREYFIPIIIIINNPISLLQLVQINSLNKK
jgi:hypothetical protein